MNSSRATILAFVGLIAILAANPALGETLRFALTGDSRSDFDGTGVNEQAVIAIGKQISRHGDIPFVLEGGDLQCGEDVDFQTPPTLFMADQLEAFKRAMAPGGLIPAGSPGVGVPVYCIRGNHETWDNVSHNARRRLDQRVWPIPSAKRSHDGRQGQQRSRHDLQFQERQLPVPRP